MNLRGEVERDEQTRGYSVGGQATEIFESAKAGSVDQGR